MGRRFIGTVVGGWANLLLWFVLSLFATTAAASGRKEGRIVVTGTIPQVTKLRICDELIAAGLPAEVSSQGQRSISAWLTDDIQALIEVSANSSEVDIWLPGPPRRRVQGPPIVPGRNVRIFALQIVQALKVALLLPAPQSSLQKRVPRSKSERRAAVDTPLVRNRLSVLAQVRHSLGDTAIGPAATLRFGRTIAAPWGWAISADIPLTARVEQRSTGQVALYSGALAVSVAFDARNPNRRWRWPVYAGLGAVWISVDATAQSPQVAEDSLGIAAMACVGTALELRLVSRLALRVQGELRTLFPGLEIL
ncbi:MAG: hypothetical protein AAFV29_15000, partial [Myxococcota bacterium]